jgi:hypothetical protein
MKKPAFAGFLFLGISAYQVMVPRRSDSRAVEAHGICRSAE